MPAAAQPYGAPPDPWAYCTAHPTVDQPAPGTFDRQAVPSRLLAQLPAALDEDPEAFAAARVAAGAIHWRCMRGEV